MLQILTKPLTVRAMLVALLLAPVLVLAFVPGLGPKELLARYLGSQFETVPDTKVVRHVQQISELGAPGTPVLVEALSRRETVAVAAGNALHAQLDQWEALPIAESGPRVMRLAHLLAGHVDQYDPNSRGIAADLITRILRWPLPRQTAKAPEFLADCEYVVQVAAGQDPTPAVADTGGEPSMDQLGQAAEKMAAQSDPSGTLNLPLGGVPGGDLPIDAVPMSPMPPSLSHPPGPRPLVGEEPELIPGELHQLPRVMFPDTKPEQEPSSVLPSSPVPGPFTPEGDDESAASELAPAAILVADDDLANMSDLELIHQLRSTGPALTEAVEAQLRERGFGDLELSMARQLCDADPAVRRQLAESLSRRNTPPGPWLLWLSYDPEPMVRRLVVSLMATTQDPRLHRRLRELQSLETDESVRAQLDRLSENGRRRR